MKAKAYTKYLATIQDDAAREQFSNSHHIGHLQRVSYVQCLVTDMRALENFFDKEEPTKVNTRAKNCHHIIHGVGEASGDGFGYSFLTKDRLSYRIGIWNDEVSNQSSKFRNFLVAFQKEGEAGRLSNSFVVFCTDNSTVKAALYKGTSDSRWLLGMLIKFICY